MAPWYLDGSAAIPEHAKQAIADDRNTVYVSDASAWEVAIKHMKRPDVMPGSAARFIEGCEATGFRWLPIDRDAIREYEMLDIAGVDGVHRDPFDRMLIAQSRASNMVLATHGEKLLLYREPLVAVF